MRGLPAFMKYTDSENNFVWLLVAISSVGFTFWHQERASNQQATIEQLQKDLASCQLEFRAFKDGVTYGTSK
jgi:hypothetical protein